MPHQMEHYDDAFPDNLDEAVSQKYMPRRQPNPHLKKYYSGKRALPWRLSTLAAHVTGSQYDLDLFKRHIWEQEKKSKLRKQQRQERSRTIRDPVETDEEVPRRRKTTRGDTRKDMSSANDKSSEKNTKDQITTRARQAQCRPHLSHLMSALKATSKRQGWLQYYTSCCCCYMADRPRILREQSMKRSLPLMIAEGIAEASCSEYRDRDIEDDVLGMVKRPKNPQGGRSRFHEGKEKALRSERKKRRFYGWYGLGGGRGVRLWMKQGLKIQQLPELDDHHDDIMALNLEDITLQEPAYPVRCVKLARGQVVIEDMERADGIRLETDYWDVDEADLSDDGSDAWMNEEWVCLSVGSDDDETELSWIELDDVSEYDES